MWTSLDRVRIWLLTGIAFLGGYALGRAVRASQYNGSNIRGYIDAYAQPYHRPARHYMQ